MSLETLSKRLGYHGGIKQQQRMIQDKLRTLKRALLYSYQAETAILNDGRQFRCLINPNKNSPSYDNKIISIPYYDICLNSQIKGKTSQYEEEIGLKPGDVFQWKETNTHWLVYLQYLRQNAYFRSQIRRCDQQIYVNDVPYWVYIRGPTQTSIEWTQKQGIEWNTPNYSLVMYITRDDNTFDYFHRFETIKVIEPISGKWNTWQVVGVDPYYGDGIIQVFLDEYFENTIKEQRELEKKQEEESQTPDVEPYNSYIDGPLKVSQYSVATYSIVNAEGGHWYMRKGGREADLVSQNDIIELTFSGELGVFKLIYRREGEQDVVLSITVQPI